MDKPANGAWCHIEIPADDVGRAKSFYANCFGWGFQEIPEMSYNVYQSGEGGIGGGLMKRPDGAPPGLVPYINCDDVEATAGKVTENGGQVIVPKTEVPNMGWFVIVTDPEGNSFGLWQGAGG